MTDTTHQPYTRFGIVTFLHELSLDTELVIKQCSMYMNIVEYHSKSLRIVLKQDCLVS